MNNKKKYILIGIGALVLISLISSIGGGKKEEVEQKTLTLKAAQTAIKGDLKGCYELVDKDYKVKLGYSDMITVELKRTSESLPYDRKNVTIFPEADESSAEYCAGFGVEILNEDGDVIDKKSANATPYSWDEMTEALQLLPEETTTIRFYFDNLDEAAKIRVTSIVMENEERTTTAATTAKSEVESLGDVFKEAAKLSTDEELDEALEDTEAALEMASKTMELAGEMLNLLGN